MVICQILHLIFRYSPLGANIDNFLSILVIVVVIVFVIEKIDHEYDYDHDNDFFASEVWQKI